VGRKRLKVEPTDWKPSDAFVEEESADEHDVAEALFYLSSMVSPDVRESPDLEKGGRALTKRKELVPKRNTEVSQAAALVDAQTRGNSLKHSKNAEEEEGNCSAKKSRPVNVALNKNFPWEENSAGFRNSSQNRSGDPRSAAKAAQLALKPTSSDSASRAGARDSLQAAERSSSRRPAISNSLRDADGSSMPPASGDGPSVVTQGGCGRSWPGGQREQGAPAKSDPSREVSPTSRDGAKLTQQAQGLERRPAGGTVARAALPDELRPPWKNCMVHVYIAHYVDFQQQNGGRKPRGIRSTGHLPSASSAAKLTGCRGAGGSQQQEALSRSQGAAARSHLGNPGGGPSPPRLTAKPDGHTEPPRAPAQQQLPHVPQLGSNRDMPTGSQPPALGPGGLPLHPSQQQQQQQQYTQQLAFAHQLQGGGFPIPFPPGMQFGAGGYHAVGAGPRASLPAGSQQFFPSPLGLGLTHMHHGIPPSTAALLQASMGRGAVSGGRPAGPRDGGSSAAGSVLASLGQGHAAEMARRGIFFPPVPSSEYLPNQIFDASKNSAAQDVAFRHLKTI